MAWLSKKQGFEKINTLGKTKTPFLFVISYDTHKILAQPLDSLEENIFYKLEEKRNYEVKKHSSSYHFSKSPLDFKVYQEAFSKILDNIRKGNTYLLNLTFETPIETNYSLKEIFSYAKAKFKLYYKDEFICFSPEKFIAIKNNTISTYPMKGTIDANTPHAKTTILANEKEKAEHIMIVDLMRNDLGIIASHIKVDSFRDVQKIKAGKKELLQVSSKISASLEENWHEHIGTLLEKILPAGSITGTPKKSTQNIIKEVENFKRGFYTGIFGIYDGTSLNSAVMIRFIEKRENQLFYKSGGGITIDSLAQSEYEELVDKIYLPF